LHLYSVRGKRLLLSNYQSRLRGDVNECNITQKMELITKARVLTRTIKFRKVINIPENPLFTKSNSSFCVNALPSVFIRSLTSFSDINLPISSHWQQSIVKRNLTTSYIRCRQGEDETNWVINRSQDGRDRSRQIPLELSMAYLESAAFKETYGDKKIWELYRRNLPGRRIAAKTRHSCIKDGRVETGNPCPICRDEYLVVDYRNVKLLEHFLTDYNRRELGWETTNVCQTQYRNLRVAIEKARDYGYLDVDAHFVEYDYSKYAPKNLLDKL